MSFSMKKCCVPGCLASEQTHEVLQSFPDPVKDHNRFNTWIKLIGGDILSLENVHIYKYRRVCRVHFEAKYLCRFNRISNDAIPTINMPVPTALQKFSNTEQRPLRRKQNTPSTSKCEYGMLSPSPTGEYMHDTPERPVTFKCYQRKPLTQIDNILTSTMNVPSPPIETANMRAKDQNTSQSKNMTVVYSDGIPKRSRRHIARRTNIKLLTLAEINLYKKLVSTRIKLSKCRAKANKQLVTLKTAQNIMSNPKFLDIMENVSPAAKLITMMQLREHQKKDKGRQFSIEEKILALSIFKQSPKGYRFLRKLLILPEPQTLTKLINKANIKPGINSKIFNQLTKKAENMKVEERLCILIYDEMSLRAHLSYNERKDEVVGFATDGKLKKCDFADHAQVFMIRGLIKNYKQPISYTFSRSATKGVELAKQLKTTISEIQKTGLIVIATICDQGTNNRQAIKILLNEARASFLRNDEEPKDNVIVINGYEIVPLPTTLIEMYQK